MVKPCIGSGLGQLNGFKDAKQKIIEAKEFLKPFPTAYFAFKEALRVLRKMKYDAD